MTPTDLVDRLESLDWSATSLEHQLAVSAAAETLRPPSNVVHLPVKQKTRWTVIKTLEGAHWASSHDFGVTGAWNWIVDKVMAEHGCDEDAISSLEADPDDLVTIDGLPMYRIEHYSK